MYWKFYKYNSRTFQNLALRFPGLSTTKLIFRDFPGSGNFTNTIPGLSRKRGNSAFSGLIPSWHREQEPVQNSMNYKM